MAITKLDNPIKLTSEEADKQYDGRWVIFQRPNISEPGFVYAYSDIGIENSIETHEKDYEELKEILFNELSGKAMLMHGCKNRGRMNLHVKFPTN